MTKKKHQIGDAPIQADMREWMNELARAIDYAANPDAFDRGDPKKIGFVLLVFPFGATDGRCNYISNGARDDIRTMLKEQLARWEGQAEVTGRA